MKEYTVITGASSGIGKAMAYTFAEKGHNLIIVARRKQLLDEIKRDIKGKHAVEVIVNEKDLSVEDNVRAFYGEIKASNVTLLINNAGFGDMNYVWDIDEKKVTQMIDLNIKALTLLSVWYTRDNKDKNVQLINVASVVGYNVFSMGTPYSATKFYVASFTEGLADNLCKAGAKMKAKILAPGPVATEFMEVARQGSKMQGGSPGQMKFHSAEEMAGFAYRLYESDKVLGIVNVAKMEFELKDPAYPVF